jgi:hypothetical protein
MFADRELATVLAALRLWQQQMSTLGSEGQQSFPQLVGMQPLSAGEIDRLCERINTEPNARLPVEPGNFVLCQFDADHFHVGPLASNEIYTSRYAAIEAAVNRPDVIIVPMVTDHGPLTEL